MRMLRKYFSRTNNFILYFAFAAIVLLATSRITDQEFSGVTTVLEAIVRVITRPIGVAISVLVAIAVGLGWSYARTRGVPTPRNDVPRSFERAQEAGTIDI
jgi:type IV secretion system protein VirB2